MQDKIKSLSDHRMTKAMEDLETSRITFQHNKLSQSVNRSYYAIFHKQNRQKVLQNIGWCI